MTPSDVWVFGTPADGTSRIGTWHFDGASWQWVQGLAGSIVRASAVTASHTVLVTATPESASATGLIVQASAAGDATAVSPPSWLTAGSISDVALADGAPVLWLSGAVLTHAGGDAMIWTGRLSSPADRVGA